MQFQTRSRGSQWQSREARFGLRQLNVCQFGLCQFRLCQFRLCQFKLRAFKNLEQRDQQDWDTQHGGKQHRNKQRWDKQVSYSQVGFTLLELTVVLTVIGVLMAIATPSWLRIVDQHRLISSQDKVVQAIRLAQSRAEQLDVAWQTSLREVNSTVQVAIHPVDTSPDVTGWENLADGIRLDVAETTLYRENNGVYRVQFNHTGRVNGQLGRFTVMSSRNSQMKQCVIIATLLGTVRRGQRQTAQDSTGRYCY